MFLKNLNIPVVDKEHFWETMHCDGGLGRYTFSIFLFFLETMHCGGGLERCCVLLLDL